MASTGSLCPYRERKSLSESTKKTRTVESSREAASSLPLGLMRTHSTSSVIFRVLQGSGQVWGRGREGQRNEEERFERVRQSREGLRTWSTRVWSRGEGQGCSR